MVLFCFLLSLPSTIFFLIAPRRQGEGRVAVAAPSLSRFLFSLNSRSSATMAAPAPRELASRLMALEAENKELRAQVRGAREGSIERSIYFVLVCLMPLASTIASVIFASVSFASSPPRLPR